MINGNKMRKNWIDQFRSTVITYRDKKAVVCGQEEVTFFELDKKAKYVGNLILEKTKVSNKPIVVLLQKSIDVVAANLGIVYSSNIFSNLDIKTPKERINNIIEALEPIGIITSKKYEDSFDLKENMFCLFIEDFEYTDSDDCALMERVNKQIDTDPFCIINTSGSTGTPKGVVLNHKSFFDFMDWSIETFRLSDDVIIGSLSPVVFDIYEYELCLLMSRGATMVLLDAGLAVFPVKLLQELNRTNVNFIFWVPTIMVNIANMDLLSKVPVNSLKTVWFAGEVFPTKQFNYWKRNLPETIFANLYGPIEITLDCIYYIVDREFNDDEPLPIGIPCNNTGILILNDEDKECQYDEEGEICIRGTSLAMGYYNNPEKTSHAFVQNPLNKSYIEYIYRTGDVGYRSSKDNLIYFKGRRDSLVKHLGYRINLGEIEHVLVNDLKMVKNCCVVYCYQKKEIALFYENAGSDQKEIRNRLIKTFPKYMIPTIWNEMEELPRNTNGKIDRLLLSKKINE